MSDKLKSVFDEYDEMAQDIDKSAGIEMSTTKLQNDASLTRNMGYNTSPDVGLPVGTGEDLGSDRVMI